MFSEVPRLCRYRAAIVTLSSRKYRRYCKLHLFSGRIMNTGETALRWKASLCHLGPKPQVYQDTGDHVTDVLSDGHFQTCELLFPAGTSSMTSVIFIHRIRPIHSPRLNVIGWYIDCSPITGLWMFVMGDSGALHSCKSYTGINIDDNTTCRYRCVTDGLVNYIVLGISDRRALPTSDTAAICDIAVIWGLSPVIGLVEV